MWEEAKQMQVLDAYHFDGTNIHGIGADNPRITVWENLGFEPSFMCIETKVKDLTWYLGQRIYFAKETMCCQK